MFVRGHTDRARWALGPGNARSANGNPRVGQRTARDHALAPRLGSSPAKGIEMPMFFAAFIRPFVAASLMLLLSAPYPSNAQSAVVRVGMNLSTYNNLPIFLAID